MRDAISIKKRDSYIHSGATGTNPSPESPAVQGQAVTIRAATQNQGFLPGFHAFLYCPSYRWLSSGNQAQTAQRTSTKPYYVGLSETYGLIPSDNSLWHWRRIVFSSKRNYGQEISGTAASQIGVQSAGGGITLRPLRDISGDASAVNYGQLYTNLAEDLFVGIFSTDWTNPIRAKVDTTRVSVISDRIRTITSHNDVARPANKKTYTRINKTVVYGDEENGVAMSTSAASVTSKSGIGNIYVVDFFNCPTPVSATTTLLTVSTQSTMYWHEK